MTTVYVPRVIRTAEEAAALPTWTVAYRVLRVELSTGTFTQPEVAVKIGTNTWESTAADEDAWDWLDRHLIGWTALVPVEAEEERWEAGAVPDFLGITFRWSAARRYVTEWEDVPS